MSKKNVTSIVLDLYSFSVIKFQIVGDLHPPFIPSMPVMLDSNLVYVNMLSMPLG